MSITLAHQQLGTGPALIVLHGLFGSGRNWLGVARRLARAHTVYLFDLPNHGESPYAQPMDHPFLAHCVWQTSDELGLQRPSILGHSLGGKVAMACAVARPTQVEHLVIEDIAPVDYPDRLTPTVEALHELDLRTLESRTEGDLRLAARLPNGALRQFLMHGLAGGAGNWHWRFDLEALARGIPAICAAPPAPSSPLSIPLLIVSGDASPYVNAEGRRAFAERFTDWREAVIPGSGHWPHAEATEAFLAAVVAFLEDRRQS
jgi:esterase